MAIHDGDAGLIAMLARPGVHSGPDLGRRLGISRVAVKKRIDRLVAAGLPVESVAGRGYRLAAGVELLSRSGILAQLAAMSDGGDAQIDNSTAGVDSLDAAGRGGGGAVAAGDGGVVGNLADTQIDNGVAGVGMADIRIDSGGAGGDLAAEFDKAIAGVDSFNAAGRGGGGAGNLGIGAGGAGGAVGRVVGGDVAGGRIGRGVSAGEAMAVDLRVFQSLGSTNQALEHVALRVGGMRAVLAESQPGGRGRRGRGWVSSPYRDLMLSVGVVYPAWPANPAALSLGFAVAVHRAIAACGVAGVGLKWPNDLVAGGRKLGGLLVNAAGEAGGELRLILGVGLNVATEAAVLDGIDQPATSLLRHSGRRVSRNRLAAAVLWQLRELLAGYPATGFAPLAGYWNRHCALRGRRVRVFAGGREERGRLVGVNAAGELCLAGEDGGERRYSSGELSLRALGD